MKLITVTERDGKQYPAIVVGIWNNYSVIDYNKMFECLVGNEIKFAYAVMDYFEISILKELDLIIRGYRKDKAYK